MSKAMDDRWSARFGRRRRLDAGSRPRVGGTNTDRAIDARAERRVARAGLDSVALAAVLGVAQPASATTGSTVPFKAQAIGHDTSESFRADGIHLTSLVTGEGTAIGEWRRRSQGH
jgi:hypothetical protein